MSQKNDELVGQGNAPANICDLKILHAKSGAIRAADQHSPYAFMLSELCKESDINGIRARRLWQRESTWTQETSPLSIL